MDFLNQEQQDIWITQNPEPQSYFQPQQIQKSIFDKDSLVTIPSGKVMLKTEHELFRQVITQRPQQVAIVPTLPQQSPSIYQNPGDVLGSHIPTRTTNIEINQKGVLILGGLFSLMFFSSVALIKIWGTTDAAKQQQFIELTERQNDKLSERYDRLAKVTEKLGKKTDVNVCLFACGTGKAETEENQVETTSYQENSRLSHISYSDDEALSEVRRWKRNGTSRNDAIAQLNWIKRNQSQYPISYSQMKQAVNELY